MDFKSIFLLGLLSICTGTSVQVPTEKVNVPDPLAPLDVSLAAPPQVPDAAIADKLAKPQEVSGQAEPPIGLVGALPSKDMTGLAADGMPPPLLPGGTVPLLAPGLKTSPLRPGPGMLQPPPETGSALEEPEFIKLFIQDHKAGIYRTQKGEYVRLFKILSPQNDLASVALPPVPVPKPMPLLTRIPVQRSLPMMTPNIMARSGNAGPTARFSSYDNFGYYDPLYYYDPSGFNGLGPFNGGGLYPYNNYGYPYAGYNGYTPYYK